VHESSGGQRRKGLLVLDAESCQGVEYIEILSVAYVQDEMCGMVEGNSQFYDQNNRAEGYVPYMGVNQIFTELNQSTDGVSAVSGITRQFLGTPIAEIFCDLPETSMLSVNDLRKSIHTQLSRAMLHIRVQDKAYRRQAAFTYIDDLESNLLSDYEGYAVEDDDVGAPIVAAAAPIRETVFRLLPGMHVNEDDLLSVEFTPVVKDSRQLVVRQVREQRLFAEPDESANVLSVIDEQYTVFEQGEDDVWHQRGVLPFRVASEYGGDPDAMTRQLKDALFKEWQILSEAYLAEQDMYSEYAQALKAQAKEVDAREVAAAVEPLRSIAVVQRTPYPTSYFNPGTTAGTFKNKYYTSVVREVYAHTPAAFATNPYWTEE
jgi:hypothetical protein